MGLGTTEGGSAALRGTQNQTGTTAEVDQTEDQIGETTAQIVVHLDVRLTLAICLLPLEFPPPPFPLPRPLPCTSAMATISANSAFETVMRFAGGKVELGVWLSRGWQSAAAKLWERARVSPPRRGGILDLGALGVGWCPTAGHSDPGLPRHRLPVAPCSSFLL